MTVLEIVSTKTNGKFDQATYLMAIEEVEQVIKNYCNIDKVPDELRFVWANMVLDLIRYEQAIHGENQEGLDEASTSDIDSISMGDTSVSLGGGNQDNVVNRAKNSHNPNLDQIVMNYSQQLHRFRRMVW